MPMEREINRKRLVKQALEIVIDRLDVWQSNSASQIGQEGCKRIHACSEIDGSSINNGTEEGQHERTAKEKVDIASFTFIDLH
jgi:hypothetical protein